MTKPHTPPESIPEIARASLEQEGVRLQDRLPRRKRVFDHDDTLMKLIIEDKKQHIVLQDMDVTSQHTDDLIKASNLQDILMGLYTKSDSLDNKAKKLFQENILRIAAQSVVNGWNSAKKRITSTEDE
jgi:hypothetical protein